MERLYEDANHAAEGCTNGHAGYKDTGRNFAAEGNYD